MLRKRCSSSRLRLVRPVEVQIAPTRRILGRVNVRLPNSLRITKNREVTSSGPRKSVSAAPMSSKPTHSTCRRNQISLLNRLHRNSKVRIQTAKPRAWKAKRPSSSSKFTSTSMTRRLKEWIAAFVKLKVCSIKTHQSLMRCILTQDQRESARTRHANITIEAIRKSTKKR